MLTNCQKPHFIEANLLNTEILFLQEFYNPPELPDGIFLFLKMHILVSFFTNFDKNYYGLLPAPNLVLVVDSSLRHQPFSDLKLPFLDF